MGGACQPETPLLYRRMHSDGEEAGGVVGVSADMQSFLARRLEAWLDR